MLVSTTLSLPAKGWRVQWLPAVLRGSCTPHWESDDCLPFQRHRPSKAKRVCHLVAVHKVGQRERDDELTLWHPWLAKVAIVSHTGSVYKFNKQKSNHSIDHKSS